MKKNEIWKIFGTEIKDMTIELLTKAEMAAHIPAEAKVIGIKPNLVSPTPASYGATTHPEIVAGIIEYLRSVGEYHIIVMEGSWVGDKTEEAFDVCGYYDLAEKYQVELRDLQKDSWSLKNCAGLDLKICTSYDEVDYLINVPVLKGHCQTKLTCALKNMKGLIPNAEKRHFHAMGLHKPIGHLSVGVHQDFVVVDHICGDLDFEDGGNPVIRNCLMAALDPVLVDAYAADLLYYEVDEIPYIRVAEKLGSGNTDLTKLQVRICGENKEEALPADRKIVELKDAVEEVESCSACYGYLIPALDQLRSEGHFEELMKKLPDRIRIGQGFRGQCGKVGIGNCTRKFDFSVPGCPPTETQIYDALVKYLDEA